MVAGVGAVEQEPPHSGILLCSLARYSRLVAILVALWLILTLLHSMWDSRFDIFVQKRARGLELVHRWSGHQLYRVGCILWKQLLRPHRHHPVTLFEYTGDGPSQLQSLVSMAPAAQVFEEAVTMLTIFPLTGDTDVVQGSTSLKSRESRESSVC